ncbi:MAG: hypothetical protein M1816_005611 [Peltula sp. TS41687]|nr:MAG: hypothetical protein M1816_005611 [Peltula sp. TS41687]
MRSIFTCQLLALALYLCGVGADKPNCYTDTKVVEPTKCPPKTPLGCVELACLALETATKTVPCPNPNCKKTPTVTSTRPCTTTCATSCGSTSTQTITTTAPCPSCYTATVTAPPRTTCPPRDCFEIQCIVESTFTAPCRNAACPRTPTVTLTETCRTTCRSGCATTTYTTTPTRCPTAYYA